MKNNHLPKLAALLVLCCVMLGCQKDNTTTTIYGTVFSSVTHEPVIGAQIEVGYRVYSQSGYFSSVYDHKISSSVSGSDGQFELQFGEIQLPSDWKWYYVRGTAEHYQEYYQPTAISIGSNYRMDISLEPWR